MQESAATGSFWSRREAQASLGKDNGLKPFTTKVFYAAAQGVTAGTAFGAFQMAYYPDRFAYAQKGTVLSGPVRSLNYIKHAVFRPAMIFSAVTVTYAAAESFLSEIKGTTSKDPWNSAFAGAAAGMVLGGFLTRRFDIATTSAIGTGLIMGLIDFNGPNIICDPDTKQARCFPAKVSTVFEESEELKNLKEKYPAFKQN
ncbi:hypothetical protein FRACYDRAFT_270572 [Fragilariopsis cylindrus CCMP1102]|uniref:NADH dehydrogenase [ubiquinone] 1 alpha subcomplex subunit 11 n=1 Tax=Fragilariopsis cylindrus CCMP1102 TaxID=635003 RepID=A0A1E7F280_9STRA|nr:hypothetical protein FRACYDRAFT_270572 [Fragilariopsis cylindrus CCMP1102]|eukprot:OEU12282.1 hypothetical protein FRACYDRAFT_270572 [Fragilariopsis cylindrus CCMP1102]